MPGGFGPVVKVLVVLLVLGAIVVLARGRLAGLITRKSVTQQVAAARDAITAQDWQEAASFLRAARVGNEGDLDLMRVTVDYLDKTGAEPPLQLQLLSTLAEKGAAHPRDALLQARAHLRNGSLAEARRLLAVLPVEIQQGSDGLDLRAAILAQEGEKEKALAARQLADTRATGEPTAAFRRAAAALQSSPSQALAELWELSRAGDASALEALRLLAQQPDLTAVQAETLLDTVRQHPDHGQADVLKAASALMRAAPARRTALLDEVAGPDAERSLEETLLLARWLAGEKEHTRMLALAPLETLLKSKELFPTLLQSMAEAARWTDMRALFARHQSLPMRDEGIQVWKALAASRLEKNLSQSEHHLRLAITGSISAKNHATLRAAAQVAEDLRLWDLAFEGYSHLASPELGHEMDMLEKCWHIAQSTGNLDLQLGTARRLRALRPTSGHFARRLDYLRLLLGDEIESTGPAPSSLGGEDNETPVQPLLRALKAYRLGDTGQLAQDLRAIQDTTLLTTGQRAVYAGLLAAIGETSRAFQLAERIPTQGLTPQEKAFLLKAL